MRYLYKPHAQAAIHDIHPNHANLLGIPVLFNYNGIPSLEKESNKINCSWNHSVSLPFPDSLAVRERVGQSFQL